MAILVKLCRFWHKYYLVYLGGKIFYSSDPITVPKADWMQFCLLCVFNVVSFCITVFLVYIYNLVSSVTHVKRAWGPPLYWANQGLCVVMATQCDSVIVAMVAVSLVPPDLLWDRMRELKDSGYQQTPPIVQA